MHVSRYKQWEVLPASKFSGKWFKFAVGNELLEIDNAKKELNVELIKKVEFSLPIEDSKRTILCFKKLKDNLKYPRKNSEISKKRL